MKMNSLAGFFLLSLAISLGIGIQIGTGQQTVQAMAKWEYKVIEIDPYTGQKLWENTLNAAGNEEWELVGISPIMRDGIAIRSHATLKRARK